MIENIGFLYGSVEKGGESWARLAFSIFERVIVGGMGHLTMSVLTALRATRRDFYGERLSWWQVIAPAALYHGAFDLCVLVLVLGRECGLDPSEWIGGYECDVWFLLGFGWLCDVADEKGVERSRGAGLGDGGCW